MKFSIIVNQKKKGAVSEAVKIESYLSERGAFCRMFLREDYSPEELRDSDFLISLGGDGTILRAARAVRHQEIPILGVNVGHLGYLAELSPGEDVKSALDELFKNRWIPDVRSMLFGEAYRGEKRIGQGYALNEILLSRQGGVNIQRFHVFCDGQDLFRYDADGLIVATPTGSTAYSLSAGGPIVSPQAPVMIMTPICPHSLNNRAVILEDSRTIQIEVESGCEAVSFDGEGIISLKEGDVVRVRKSEHHATLVKLQNGSFLDILRRKMKNV